MALTEQLPVYRDVYKLTRMLFDITQAFPREYKYSLGQDRTKGNFYDAVERFNEKGEDVRMRTCQLKRDFRSSINSYLGIMSHYSTYNIRRREIYSHLSPWWRNRISPKNYCRKIKI